MTHSQDSNSNEITEPTESNEDIRVPAFFQHDFVGSYALKDFTKWCQTFIGPIDEKMIVGWKEHLMKKFNNSFTLLVNRKRFGEPLTNPAKRSILDISGDESFVEQLDNISISDTAINTNTSLSIDQPFDSLVFEELGEALLKKLMLKGVINKQDMVKVFDRTTLTDKIKEGEKENSTALKLIEAQQELAEIHPYLSSLLEMTFERLKIEFLNIYFDQMLDEADDEFMKLVSEVLIPNKYLIASDPQLPEELHNKLKEAIKKRNNKVAEIMEEMRGKFGNIVNSKPQILNDEPCCSKM